MFRRLLTNTTSILMALFFAIVVWIVATNEENPFREGLFPDALPIAFENRGDDLTLLDPSRLTARVRIRTEANRWDTLNNSNFKVVADLGGLIDGEHAVPLTAVSEDANVRVLGIDPPSVQLRLEKIETVPLAVRVRVLDEPPLGYEIKPPQVLPPTVNVTGPQSDIQRVFEASVETALREAKTTVERQALVTLYDAQGNQIQNLQIEPAVVTVTIPIEQRVGYKDAAVKALISGNPESGYWVSDINVDPATVTLVGAPEALNLLGGFVETEALDVNGANQGLTQRVRLRLPEGVSVLNATDVSLRVAIEPVLSGLTVQRQVSVSDRCNLPSEVSPETVQVILSGPLPILQTIQNDDVQILVDPPRCEEGSYQANLRAINIPERIRVESIVPATAEVNIQDVNP